MLRASVDIQFSAIEYRLRKNEFNIYNDDDDDEHDLWPYCFVWLLKMQVLDLSDASSEEEDVVEDYLGEGPAYKMVFVVNSDLSMGIGKTASQVAHAAIGLYRLLIEEQQRFGEMLLYWEQFG